MSDLEFRQQGTDMPKGSASQLEEQMDLAASAPEAPTFDAAEIDMGEVPEVLGEPEPDEFDDELFSSPTLFENRPLTHGVPIGPGSDFVVAPRMSDRAILHEAARRILTLRGDVPTGASHFAARVLAGD